MGGRLTFLMECWAFFHICHSPIGQYRKPCLVFLPIALIIQNFLKLLFLLLFQFQKLFLIISEDIQLNLRDQPVNLDFVFDVFPAMVLNPIFTHFFHIDDLIKVLLQVFGQIDSLKLSQDISVIINTQKRLSLFFCLFFLSLFL